MNKHKKTIIFLVAETGTGKDSVAKLLPYPKVVSYTTRLMRREDINGISHYFVSNRYYNENIKGRTDILAYTEIGDIKYWALEEDLADISIYIIDPAGVRWFKENYKGPELNYIIIGLYLPLEERINRCKNRSDFDAAFYKRVADEQRDFDLFRLNGEFDYILKNDNSSITAEIIKNIIVRKCLYEIMDAEILR